MESPEVPDLAEAAAMLRALHGDSPVTFQSFDESPAKRHRLSRILHGSLEQHAAALIELNADGAGVFVMVNDGDGQGRKKENVRAIRAVFVDLDGAPLEPVKNAPLPPHLVTQTSPERFHAFWMVSGLLLEQFRSVQQALATRFCGDASVCDLARVMRLAGFMHLKGTPFRCRVLDDARRDPYPVAELTRALGIEDALRNNWKQKPNSTGSIYEGARNDTLLRLSSSWRNRGYGRESILKRIKTVNQNRCCPPLEWGEVERVVAQALAYPVEGSVSLLRRELDSDAFLSASAQARCLYLEARRKFDGSPVSLTQAELRERGLDWDHKTLAKYKAECNRLGLLQQVRAASFGRRGRGPLAALFTLPLAGRIPTSRDGQCGQESPPVCINREGERGSE